MKEILKNLSKIICITLLLIMAMGFIAVNGAEDLSGRVGSGAEEVEIFSEYIGSLNGEDVPSNLFPGTSTFCIQHGTSVKEYMTASQAFYNAAMSGGSCPDHFASYNSANPYAHYGWHCHAVGLGFCCHCGYCFQSWANMPKANSPLTSIMYRKTKTYSISEYPELYFLASQMSNLNEQQKQAAFWGSPLNHNKDFGHGGNHNEYEDNMYGSIANKYTEFYNTVHAEGGGGYGGIVQAYYVDENTKKKAEPVEEAKEPAGLGEDKTYEYKDTKIIPDTEKKTYTIGPFWVDYTVDDDNRDTHEYGKTDGLVDNDGFGERDKTKDEENGITDKKEEVEKGDFNKEGDWKFNAIQNITVYNQNKVDIKTLGGNFSIKQLKNSVMEENKQLAHINEYKTYAEANQCDGKLVDAFDSNAPFWIVVEKGTMKDEDFTDFYAKITFQYLETIEVQGQLNEYQGFLVDYYYELEGGFHSHDAYLRRVERSAADAQAQINYSNVNIETSRVYKTYTIVIKTKRIPEIPTFSLSKIDPTINELEGTVRALYGAKFDIEFKAVGEDGYRNKVDKTINYISTLTTNTMGLIDITSNKLKAQGLNLEAFTGRVTVKFTEIQPPAGYELDTTPKEMVLELKDGRIVSGTANGQNVIVDAKNNKATIIVENKKKPSTPIIKLIKVNEKGTPIKEAYFKIQVAYNDPETGKWKDYANRIIRGKTKDGILELTEGDFLYMDNGAKINIKNYTGMIALRIREVSVTDGNYTTRSEDAKIYLQYENGKLINFPEEYNDKTSEVSYLYSTIYEQIYNNKMPNELSKIINKNQLADYKKIANDALKKANISASNINIQNVKAINILKNAAKEAFDEETIEKIEEYIFSLNIEEKNGVQTVKIAIKDEKKPYEPEIPDIPPPTPQPETTLMSVAGIVFLDESTTKEGIESDGKITSGEKLLSGIEVTLLKWNETTNTWEKANLVQATGHIRTNPTLTDEDGYYEFNGVDSIGKYLVQFKYNGVEYNNTISNKEEYNTENWNKSSKGTELIKDRDTINGKYSEISATTNAYNYDEIESVYAEIADRTRDYINANNRYPDGLDDDNEERIKTNPVYQYIIKNHPDDKEIVKKIQFTIQSRIYAYAGHNSTEGMANVTDNGTYPYYKKFTTGEAIVNTPNGYITVGDEKIPSIYPGQRFINLGLVERGNTDLSLKVDLETTTESINKKDIVYEYNRALEDQYTGYIHEEDYNYYLDSNGTKVKKNNSSDTSNDTKFAYYTDDEIEYYMTYRIDIKNNTGIETAVKEIVDYYDTNFIYNQAGYITSKGNKISGIKIHLNGKDATDTFAPVVSDKSKYTLSETHKANIQYKQDKNSIAPDYKMLFITMGNENFITNAGDKVEIWLTFKMDRGKAQSIDKAYKNFYDHLSKEEEASWDIGNYAEINAYKTKDGYLDDDSKPGNFSIDAYKGKIKEYNDAYANYAWDPKNEEYANKMVLVLEELTRVKEDDGSFVNITLYENDKHREINGNVWEAISDDVKNSLGLSSNDIHLTYDEAKQKYGDKINLAGIKVELVELCEKGANEGQNDQDVQIIRGVRTTNDDGSYNFTSYIPGKYTVRFIYGDYKDGEHVIYSKGSTNTVGDPLPITGAYYQSTKANPDTNKNRYWYDNSNRDKEKLTLTFGRDDDIRYSDAYDDSYTRLSQINSNLYDETQSGIPGNRYQNTSSDYDYQAITQIESARHSDAIFAYTSTLDLEVEYTVPDIMNGNAKNRYYTYNVQNIDFGLTPRTLNDINVDKYVENIKLYLTDGTKKVDVTFDKDGKILEGIGSDLIRSLPSRGNIDIAYDEYQLQGGTVEVTYRIIVSNDTEYKQGRRDSDKVYETIKYVRDGSNKVVAIAYYEEDMRVLPSYEEITKSYYGAEQNGLPSYEEVKKPYYNCYKDGLAWYKQEGILYHNEAGKEYDTDFNGARSEKYVTVTTLNEENPVNITSRASNIVDFVTPQLGFLTKDYEGNTINGNWELAAWKANGREDNNFVSSRGNYENPNTKTNMIESYSTKLRAKDGSPLYKVLLPGESTSDAIILTSVLGSTGVDKDGNPTEVDLTGADYEFKNFIELVKVESLVGERPVGRNITAGRPLELEGYDFNQDNYTGATSEIRHIADVDEGDTFSNRSTFAPTLGTNKSQIISIGAPTGLNENQRVIMLSMFIGTISLIIFAGGVIAIKKFVLKPKNG